MLAAAAISLALGLTACNGAGDEDEKQQAVAAAGSAYNQAKARGADLTDGPCLSEQLPGIEGWVADIAHDPRAPVDDDPANQCQRYRSGEADHFVELTPTGELIRAE